MGQRSQSIYNLCVFILAAVLASACAQDGGSSPARDPQGGHEDEKPHSERTVPARHTCMKDQGETDGPSIIGGQRLTRNGLLGKGVVRVFIMAKTDGVHYEGFSCTGSLIGSNIVMTAAHCFLGITPDKYVQSTTVSFGNDPLAECYPETRRAEAVIVNSGFNKDNFYDGNDFTLIRIAGSAPSWTVPLPVATNFVSDLRTEDVYLAGFGKSYDADVQEQSVSPLGLATVRALGPLGTIPEAQADLVRFLAGYNTEAGRFLAFDQSHGQSLCMGDSGGPALVRDNGVLKVVGVASFVIYRDGAHPTCKEAVAHASVSFHRQWLEENYQALMTDKSSPNPFALVPPMASVH